MSGGTGFGTKLQVFVEEAWGTSDERRNIRERLYRFGRENALERNIHIKIAKKRDPHYHRRRGAGPSFNLSFGFCLPLTASRRGPSIPDETMPAQGGWRALGGT
jgi:hypothetical protein